MSKGHVTFCFGRLNPPHFGHSSLIRAVKEQARGGAWFIFTSKSHDKKIHPGNKNPLPYHEKVEWIDKINPGLGQHFIRDANVAKTYIEAAAWLFHQGYTSATFVAGDEDLAEMKGPLVHYNGKQTNEKGEAFRHGFYHFQPFTFHANPRETSATSARAAAIEGNEQAFQQATKVPSDWTVNGKTLYEAVRQALVPELESPEPVNTNTPGKNMKAKGPAMMEGGKKQTPPSKPRNFVAKNAINTGAGAHKDKKKAMKQGDQKHKKNAMELAENRHRHGDAYERDQAAATANMDRPHDHRGLGHELAHERNNIAIAINGKTWKVILGRGYADSPEEWKYLQHMKDWAARKSASSGKKWTVHLTGANPTNESRVRLADALDEMFEERVRLKEAVLRPDTQSSLPNIRIHPDLDNSSPYKAYRYGVAMAGQPSQDFDPDGPIGQKMITVGYTEAEDAIVKATDKVMSSKSRAITSKGSKELADTNTVSPIAKPKRNKYGV